mmetsp:Transcript_29341/g.33690  ORF Transcript_29341/g.33690 Transcript_29341/m.33690 type:complete len:812 (-) Transcript_29341:408-2843(-)
MTKPNTQLDVKIIRSSISQVQVVLLSLGVLVHCSSAFTSFTSIQSFPNRNLHTFTSATSLHHHFNQQSLRRAAISRQQQHQQRLHRPRPSQIFSTKEADLGLSEPLFEDVDGIGKLTNDLLHDQQKNQSLPSDTFSEIVISDVETLMDPVALESALNTELAYVASQPPSSDIHMDTTTATNENVDQNNETNDDVPKVQKEIDYLSNISSEEQTRLIDPEAVVEAVIGTAMDESSVASDILANPHEFFQEKEAEEDVIEVSSIGKIVKFAIPACGVWLCSPLLSLIDTSSVGLLSGTIQQAALNPAVAVTDYGALLVAFMYTASTNLIAGAKESEKSSKDKPMTTNRLINALQFSGVVGLLLGSALISLGPILLKTIIGNDTIDPEVFAAALRYVRIRALGMPAAVIIGSAQSACIGMQDVRSPMYVLAAAAVVNFIGDVIFVPQKSALIGGAAGAAWATVFSQYAAMFMFYKWLTHKPKPVSINISDAILELTGKSVEGKSRRKQFRRALRKISMYGETDDKVEEPLDSDNVKVQSQGILKLKSLFSRKQSKPVAASEGTEKDFSVKGFLATNKNRLLKLPSLDDAKVFWPYVLPVTTTQIGRVSAYIAMSNVVSSSLGTLSMAANQVVLCIFYCLTPIADSLNLTAQSFVPGVAERKKDLRRGIALRELTYNFIKVGGLFGLGSVGLCCLIPFISRYFTSDPVVAALVNTVVPSLIGFFSVHGLVCGLEGVILGQKDLNFLGKSYGSFFFLVPFFLFRVKWAAVAGVKSASLKALWNVFFGYNLLRSSMFLLRVLKLSDDAMKDAESADE